MKRLRKLITGLTIIAVILSLTTLISHAAGAPTISIDGNVVTINSSYGTPFIDSAGRLQAPIRAVAEKLGATVTWDQSTSSAVINNSIKFKVGASTIITPYGIVAMDTTSVNKGGRIYVPIRFLTDALGYDITTTTTNGIFQANIVTKVELTISAAASLKNALTELQSLYITSKPNSKLTLNFGASGTLQAQIEQGAPVDVFFSAASKNIDTLKSKGLLVDNSVRNLLGNDVVLIVPKDSTLKASNFTDVATNSVSTIGLGDPASVPAGQYAQDVFNYYKIWDTVKAKAVFGTPVTQILSWVETGNVDCGVVYSTDAASSAKVKIVATAIDASHTPIVYPAAVIKASNHVAAATDFVRFLSTEAVTATFKKYGFSIL